jgi:dTDP-4-dehydrorhamnose 3,5-epimerase-like enzyme
LKNANDEEARFQSYKDSPGPAHAPEVTDLEIPGVRFWRAPQVNYSGGILTEVHRNGWVSLFSETPIDHLYWIEALRGQERDWGYHAFTTDRYALITGTVSVALVDMRSGPGIERLLLVKLDPGDGLTIPPGVAHTFSVLSETAILANSKSPPYDANAPDKRKISLTDPWMPRAW